MEEISIWIFIYFLLRLKPFVKLRCDNNTYLRLFIVAIYWHLYSLNRCKKLMFSAYDLYTFSKIVSQIAEPDFRKMGRGKQRQLQV